MTVTSNTQALRVAQTPAALLALAQHIVDHQLPAPYTIESPSYSATGDLLVMINPDHKDAWLATVTLGDESAEIIHSQSAGRYSREMFWVTQPDLGITFVIKAIGALPAVEAV